MRNHGPASHSMFLLFSPFLPTGGAPRAVRIQNIAMPSSFVVAFIGTGLAGEWVGCAVVHQESFRHSASPILLRRVGHGAWSGATVLSCVSSYVGEWGKMSGWLVGVQRCAAHVIFFVWPWLGGRGPAAVGESMHIAGKNPNRSFIHRWQGNTPHACAWR